jgi:cephalosporin hydroxylase
MRDSYAGVQMYKFPDDLRVDEHLMWLARPNVVIEIGSYFGGSALWFRDRLRTRDTYGAQPACGSSLSSWMPAALARRSPRRTPTTRLVVRIDGDLAGEAVARKLTVRSQRDRHDHQLTEVDRLLDRRRMSALAGLRHELGERGGPREFATATSCPFRRPASRACRRRSRCR